MARLSVPEILRKVRRVRLAANRQVDDLLSGGYQSVFRGQGMEFDEVREYQPGDDIRSIDWNVTARAGRPFVKRYSEERELTVLFVVDVSASGVFGSQDGAKLDLLIELAAVLMFAAARNQDKVGLLFFAGEVLQFVPPRKGRGHVMRCLRELVAVEPRAGGTDIAAAAEYLRGVQKRRAVVFLLSDFLAPLDERVLAAVKHRHDLIAVSVSDPHERELPAAWLRLLDPETGELVEADGRSPAVRRAFADKAARGEARLAKTLRRSGVDRLPLCCGEAYLQTLLRFFEMRRRRVH
ncbi:MAG TPA: DUF58 domain-containing protein [Planctomycetota bacterium]